MLDESNLLGADFSAANLAKADLRNARINNANFTGARLGSTIWVDRKRCHPDSVTECR
jgi:uncharacterized protein YjbI with pentapeptide repeats